MFEEMEEQEGEFSIIATYMRAARTGQRIIGFPLTEVYWKDMGTPERLAELRTYLEERK